MLLLLLLWERRLRTLYTPQKYFFVVSTYQACVLLQFQSAGSDALSYSDLETGTGLNAETLKPVLAILVKQRVLEQKDGGATYELNLGFKSKKIRVPLNVPVKAEQKAESAEVMKVKGPSLFPRNLFSSRASRAQTLPVLGFSAEDLLSCRDSTARRRGPQALDPGYDRPVRCVGS